MHKFILNSECFTNFDLNSFKTLFSNTLNEFKTIVNDNSLKITKAIVTEKTPSKITIGKYTLQNVIEKIEDKDLRTVAFSYFIKYPIDDHINTDNVYEVLEKEPHIFIGNTKVDLVYLPITAINHGFAFSVAIHEDIRKNALQILTKREKYVISVNNLFGLDSNTEYIKSEIKKLNFAKLDLIDKLKTTLGKNILAKSFEKDFLSLSEKEQESIIEMYDRAKKRKLQSKFYPDTKIIKDVSPDNFKCKVYELRIYSPTAIRVYFNESRDKVYIATIQKKSNPDQTKDIKQAHSILYKLILTS